MDERTSCYDDTNYSEPAEERRSMRVTLFEKAFLVEKHIDPMLMVEDPQNIYVRKLGFAAGRKWDDTIFNAAFADVRTGKTGNTTVSWSEANDDCRIITSTQTGGLTLNALIESAVYLDEGEWMEPDEPRYIFLPPRAVGDLLKDDKVPSVDYNSVRALVSGQLDTFMGSGSLNQIACRSLMTDSITEPLLAYDPLSLWQMMTWTSTLPPIRAKFQRVCSR